MSLKLSTPSPKPSIPSRGVSNRMLGVYVSGCRVEGLGFRNPKPAQAGTIPSAFEGPWGASPVSMGPTLALVGFRIEGSELRIWVWG